MFSTISRPRHWIHHSDAAENLRAPERASVPSLVFQHSINGTGMFENIYQLKSTKLQVYRKYTIHIRINAMRLCILKWKSGFPIMWRNSSLTKQIFTLGEVMTVSVRRNQWQYVIAETFKWIRFLQGDCSPKSDCACIQRLGPLFDWKSTLMAQTPNSIK